MAHWIGVQINLVKKEKHALTVTSPTENLKPKSNNLKKSKLEDLPTP